MPFVSVGKENSGSIELHYEDFGSGPPVVLIHGYPLSGAAWERQVAHLLATGHRVITYDRRGFGVSSKPSVGYDYDTFAADLQKLVAKLELRDFALVGHSMGTGEVTRYIAKYGGQLVTKAVLIAPLAPFLLKTDDNPGGVPGAVFADIQQAIRADRYVYAQNFLDNFYNVDVFGGKLVSDHVLQNSWRIAAQASPIATLECVSAWLTDFRKDVTKLDVPLLIIQGDADRILPINATGNRLVKLVKGARLITIPGGPHGIPWTHAEVVNRALSEFLG